MGIGRQVRGRMAKRSHPGESRVYCRLLLQQLTLQTWHPLLCNVSVESSEVQKHRAGTDHSLPTDPINGPDGL